MRQDVQTARFGLQPPRPMLSRNENTLDDGLYSSAAKVHRICLMQKGGKQVDHAHQDMTLRILLRLVDETCVDVLLRCLLRFVAF